MAFIDNLAIAEVDEGEQDAGLLIWGVVKNWNGLVVDRLFVLKDVNSAISCQFSLVALNNDHLDVYICVVRSNVEFSGEVCVTDAVLDLKLWAQTYNFFLFFDHDLNLTLFQTQPQLGQQEYNFYHWL